MRNKQSSDCPEGEKRRMSVSKPPKPRRHIPAIMAYPPGKPIEEVQREYGLDSVIKLASNENPLGPSPLAVRAMQEVASEMHLYPDGNGFYLKEALSKKHGFAPERIMLGNGTNELLDLIVLGYVGPTENIVISQYDFIGYRLSALKVNASVREAPLKDWRVDVKALAKTIDSKTRLVCIANPSNPVGTIVKKRELEWLLGNIPEKTLLLMDEAYFEYANDPDYPDAMQYVDKYPNLIVTRTFSKAYGLAGLRIGYGIADPDIVMNIDRVRAPFNTNRISQAAAIAALKDKSFLAKAVKTNASGRKTIEEALDKLQLNRVPSQTNFILFDAGRPGAEVMQSLLKQGVIVRPMGGYGLPRHLRVTIGLPAENRRFIASLKRSLKEVHP
jgi:histidinol-phosphate aminotransferase